MNERSPACLQLLRAWTTWHADLIGGSMESRKHAAIVIGTLVLLGAVPSLAADYRANSMDQPRVSERQAREIGLDRVPQGSVLTQRLEEHNGRQVWFLDI